MKQNPVDVTIDYSRVDDSPFLNLKVNFPHIKLFKISRRPCQNAINTFIILLILAAFEYANHPPQTWWIFLPIFAGTSVFILRTLIRSYKKRNSYVKSAKTFDLVGFYNIKGFNYDLSLFRDSIQDAVIALTFCNNPSLYDQKILVNMAWVNSNMKSFSSWLHFIFLMSVDYISMTALYILFLAERNSVGRLNESTFQIYMVLIAFFVVGMMLWWLNDFHRWLIDDLPKKANSIPYDYNIKRGNIEITKEDFVKNYNVKLSLIDRSSTLVLFMQAIALFFIPILTILVK